MRIAVPITANTIKDIVQQIKQARQLGAHIIELRVDHIPNLTPDHLDQLRQQTSDIETILTIRSPQEGGHFDQDEEIRINLIQHALTLSFTYIDIELTTLEQNPELLRHPGNHDRRELLSGIPNEAKQKFLKNSKLILSYHNFNQTHPDDQLQAIITQMRQHNPHIYKLACKANSQDDTNRLLKLILDHPDLNTIIIGMGQHGTLTRILGPLLGGYLTFASIDNESTSAPGQINIAKLKSIYQSIQTLSS